LLFLAISVTVQPHDTAKSSQSAHSANFHRQRIGVRASNR